MKNRWFALMLLGCWFWDPSHFPGMQDSVEGTPLLSTMTVSCKQLIKTAFLRDFCLLHFKCTGGSLYSRFSPFSFTYHIWGSPRNFRILENGRFSPTKTQLPEYEWGAIWPASSYSYSYFLLVFLVCKDCIPATPHLFSARQTREGARNFNVSQNGRFSSTKNPVSGEVWCVFNMRS